MSQPFTLYRSDSLGRASNCIYPHAVEVTDSASLAAAVSFDYVAVEYKNGYRNNANFIKTNCLMLDCDNDHSEDPAAWITPQVLADSLLDVAFAVHYSRSNGKVKNGKAARPKFHVFFPIPEQTDPAAYSDMKKRLQAEFPFFDSNALDAARFFFGTSNPEVEFFDGCLTPTSPPARSTGPQGRPWAVTLWCSRCAGVSGSVIWTAPNTASCSAAVSTTSLRWTMCSSGTKS